MEIRKKYPREFIDFLRRLEITTDNVVVENQLDKETDFVSQYFTPHSSIGELSRKILETIHARELLTTNSKIKKDSLGDLILNSNLLKVHPNLRQYIQIILLESLAIEIAIDHIPKLREHMSEEDIDKVRENIVYALDIISVDPRFTEIYKHLQELYIDLGYIQAQIPVIKRDGEEILNG